MQFVAGIAELPELVVNFELLRGRNKACARALAAMVPAALRAAPCFLDRMTGLWLYDFGDPVMTGQGFVYGGAKTWHRLTTLIDVVACAHTRLDPSVFADYLTRLEDPTKHADLLFEFAPVLRLDPTATARYEVTGESPGNKTIDWKIEAADGFSILLEVKRREADFISSVERIASGERAVDGTVPAPEHDTDLLFRSVEAKSCSDRQTGCRKGRGSALRSCRKRASLSSPFADWTQRRFTSQFSAPGTAPSICSHGTGSRETRSCSCFAFAKSTGSYSIGLKMANSALSGPLARVRSPRPLNAGVRQPRPSDVQIGRPAWSHLPR